MRNVKTEYLLAAAAVLTLAVMAVLPKMASADATAPSWVVRTFDREMLSRAKVSGIHVVKLGMHCAPDGGGYYECWATAITREDGRTAKVGTYLHVTPTRWKQTGDPQTIWVH